ncbi:MAG: hypothetical protein QOJ99_2468 [Bryobacterales bacterium]|nr:hypothetical protein [Bryobacterales bacterium]
MIVRRLLCLSLVTVALGVAEEYTYWIDPCTAAAATATRCEAGDPELGKWALEAWARESGGALTFRKSETEAHARIRLRWANGQGSLYGETQPITVDGKRGAMIYVLPETGRPGGDPLLRDTIVYLTCLHESGHALGLPHTAGFADIMYNFRYGGDLVEYFARYRRLLKTRAEIAKHAGVSDADRVALRQALK